MAARAFGRLFLVLSIGVAAGSCRQGRLAFRGRPPVILISVDTLRADMLPVYGRRDLETPAIDALRRDGIPFTNAFSHVPLTLPSHLTMFTGLLPFEHGVLATNGSGPDGSASACRFPPSAVLVSPLPEVASAPGCQKSGAGQFVSWISSEPIAGTPRIRVAKTKIGRSVRIGASDGKSVA